MSVLGRLFRGYGVVAFAGLTLLGGAHLAQGQAREAPTRVTLAVEKSRLPNGLEVILHEDHRSPAVAVNVWYHVGSKDEAPGRSGFAHLFEHLMFQGSKHVPEDHFFKYLQSAGGTDYNGTTNEDRTNYFETVPKNRLELALWLESDRMGFLLDHVDQKTLAEQREVVKNERRLRVENVPYGNVSGFIHEAFYPQGHPYHLSPIGTAKDLDAASLEDVKGFFRTWYVPNNATLVIAGDFDKAKTLQMVDKYFAPIPSGTLPARAPVPPVVLTKETRLDIVAGVELAQLSVSWPTPPSFAAGDAELDALARILGGSKTTRLTKKLTYDLQIAQGLSVNQASRPYGSMFSIGASIRPGHTAEEVLRIIDEELASVRTSRVSEAELARAKTSIVSAMTFRLDTISGIGGRADLINNYNQNAGDPAFLARDVARNERVTVEGIHDAVMQYLPADKRMVTIVTPVKGAPMSGQIRGAK
jgi:zinc protease